MCFLAMMKVHDFFGNTAGNVYNTLDRANMNLKRLKKISLIGFLIGTLIACDSDDDSLLSETPNDSNQPTTTVTESSENSTGVSVGLNGSWFLSCRPEDPDPDSASTVHETIQLNIQDDVFETISTQFTDSTCTNLEPFSPQTRNFSVVFNGITETTLGAASNIDLTVDSIVVTGLEELGSDIDGIGEMFLEIVLVMDDSLFFGQSDDVEVAEPEAISPRPIQLNLTDVFTRLP